MTVDSAAAHAPSAPLTPTALAAPVANNKVLNLCADDYGASHGICDAVLELAESARLSATSVLTGCTAWPARAAELAALPAVRQGRVQVGLHFNLTEGAPVSRELAAHRPSGYGLGSLIAQAHLHLLPRAALAAEWKAQWQAFVQAFGRAPDYVDGHQHVHHLPQVREVMLEALSESENETESGLTNPPAVRATGRLPGRGHAFKRWVIESTGGSRLQQTLKSRGLRHNTTLWGVYDFVDEDYGALMRRWLRDLPAEGALLFCHPGKPQPTSASSQDAPGSIDLIAPAREREWRYLSSENFVRDLREAQVVLGTTWVQREIKVSSVGAQSDDPTLE